jgi:hypothetical protein
MGSPVASPVRSAVASLFRRRSIRVVAVAGLLAVMTATATPVRSTDDVRTAGEDAAASVREVRLRKLHLVRPDLIPYPIAYEVCC